MLMPWRVVPTFAEAHTRCVVESASGSESIQAAPPRDMPFSRFAE